MSGRKNAGMSFLLVLSSGDYLLAPAALCGSWILTIVFVGLTALATLGLFVMLIAPDSYPRNNINS
jgi:hypothetical protein